MQSFPTIITDPRTEDKLKVIVEYEMLDIGVMMKHNENVQPVILSVSAGKEQFITELDEEDILDLEQQAREYDQDRVDLRNDDDNLI